MGVPNGEERKIFEAFYRAHDSLSSGIQGSGLGLTLAQRLAQEHGGTIKFERRDGGGSGSRCGFRWRKRLSVASIGGERHSPCAQFFSTKCTRQRTLSTAPRILASSNFNAQLQ